MAEARHHSSLRLVVDGLDASALNEGFLRLMRAGGADCRHVTIFGFEGYTEHREFVAAHAKEIVVAETVKDIREAHRDGKVSIVFGAQCAAGPVGNGLDTYIMGASLGDLSLLAKALPHQRVLGLRTQGICYNVLDLFGGGCLDHTVSLTRVGRRLVEAVHENRIVLDVGGHTGERTSLDAIEMSSGVPVVCTHTNMAGLNANARCISNRLAEAIARTGGVIGLTAISDFHVRNAESANSHGERSPRATLAAHLDHYDYLKRLVGVDHIALGPDFIWNRGDSVPFDPVHSVMFPPDAVSKGILQTIDGFSDISELPNLIRGLGQRGWTEEELDKVLGENWLRVYEKVWGS